MNQLIKNICVIVFVMIANQAISQESGPIGDEKVIVWSKIENGFQVQFIRESDHEYILRTPLELLNKVEQQPHISNYAGPKPYGNSYELPEIQSPELVKSRLQSLYVGVDMAYNPTVQKEINSYLHDRRLIEKAIGRSKYFSPISDSIIATKPHLPRALKHLPMVESNFKPKSYSRMGARGIWQFMKGTGRLYGLTINSTKDARLDPVESADAAFRYLEDLNQTYNDWFLTLAAYNAGPGRVNRAIRKSGIENPSYWDLQPFLPKETRKYVPRFIAAVYVLEYSDQMGLLPNWEEYAEVEKEIDDIKAVKYAPNHVNTLYASTSGIPENSVILTYTIKSGDNLGSIAEWYDISAKKLRLWNGINGNLIHPGQKLKVYVDADRAHIYEDINKLSATNNSQKKNESKNANQETTALLSDKNYVVYKIRSGDTLWSISKENGIPLQTIKQLNNFPNSRNLKPGMVIKLREKS